MKKTLFLLFTLHVFSNTFLSAQIQFAPVGSTYYYWAEYQNNNEGPFFPYIVTMNVLSDTVIEGQNCRKIGGADLSWRCGEDGVMYNYVYEENGQVYHWNRHVANFELLYDFTKNAGESWQVPSFCGGIAEQNCPADTFSVIVDSVSYVEINNISVKVQHVSLESENLGGSGFTIYEGIGCIDHFYYWKDEYCFTIHDYFRGLRCFDSPVDGSFPFFMDDGQCDMIVWVEKEPRTIEVSIYPNPFMDEVIVATEGAFSVTLYDLLGRPLFLQKDIYQQTTLNLKSYLPGTYFISIQQGDSRLIHKVIKQER